MISRLSEHSKCWRRIALASLACVVLAACQSRTDLFATGNVPSAYTHVWVTLKEVAFNTSATAGPTDSGWKQFTLPAPQTIDLAATTNGALSQFASNLSLPSGTYSQMRLVLVDSQGSLTTSAQTVGASYNDEVDTADSSGNLQREPLQVPNAAAGITLPIDFVIQSSQQAALAAFACGQSSGAMGLGSPAMGIGVPGMGMAGSGGNCEYGTQTASQCTPGTIFDSLIGTCIAIGNAGQFMGQTMGAYGQTGMYGQPGVYGQTPGVYGQTAGVYGQPTGVYGQQTGVYGQPTGVFGQTAATGSSCGYGTTFDPTTGACISMGTTAATICNYNQVYDPATGTCASTGFGGGVTVSAAVDFDASRDLVPYSLGGQPGFLLIPHVAGYNQAQAGTIAGQVDVSALPSTGIGGIEVTAETRSADGSRNVIVAGTPLEPNGSFVLYPLPCTGTTTNSSAVTGSTTSASSCASATQYYDLVIHGPGIATVIIQQVPVTAGAPSSATVVPLGVTLIAAASYNVNLSSAVSPPGAWVGFYQTLPDSSATTVPYLIEARPVDPFTGLFDTAQALSSASVWYGIYASGGAITLTGVTPAEGASTYRVAASAPVYGDGPLSTTVAPPSGSTSITTFTAAPIPLPSGTAADTISGTVSVTSPGKYDQGMLVLTQDGSLVAVSSLNGYLGAPQSSATLFSSVPGGTSTSVYYAEAWVWSSSDPAGTLSRQPLTTPIDLSSGSATGVAVTIN